MEITSGKISSAKKVVLYGPEGIGKSTFASKFPNPVFIDTEGSTKEMDVDRIGPITDWDDIMVALDYCYDYKTVVIDTADWAEMYCSKYTCGKGNVKHIEDFGYGKGYTYLQENFKNLLELCELKLLKCGINIVFTAHAKMRKFEQPDEMGAYDRWEMKLTKQVAPMLKEWADIVLFANYKTYVVEDDKTKSKKAQGGKRVMYTSHHPCWDAKNRYGLGECIPFDYEEIKQVIEGETSKKAEPEKKSETKPEELLEKKQQLSPEHMELQELMMKDGISVKRLEYAVATKRTGSDDFVSFSFEDYEPEFIQKSLIDKWDGFCKYAKKFSEEEIEQGFVPFN